MNQKRERLQGVVKHYPEYVRGVIGDFQQRYPKHGLGVYEGYEWNRVAFASSLAIGSSVLDVGSGNGALLTMLHGRGCFERLNGIDIRRLGSLRLPPEVEFREMSILGLEFADKAFDTVVCMEVIEHLPVDQVDRALSELRRVARTRLIMTVPYGETYPLFHQDRDGGHKQNFEDEKLRRLFPNAWFTQIPHHRVNWALIVENPGADSSAFRILDSAEFARHFRVQPFLHDEGSWRGAERKGFNLLQRLKKRLPVNYPLRRLYRYVKSLAVYATKHSVHAASRVLATPPLPATPKRGRQGASQDLEGRR